MFILLKIRPGLTSLFLTSMVCSSAVSAVELDVLDDWSVYGTNTVRSSLYGAEGPRAGSPYPDEGDMYYDEFNIYLNKRQSQYDFMRAEITGVYNLNDDYRSPDFGFVPERMNFSRENGEGNLPYRLELGDHFAYYSYLTLQRSLKGGQLEFQPRTDFMGYQQSVILTSGADESNWRDLTPKDNYTNGASWLLQNSHGGFSLNVVHNYRDNSIAQGTQDRNQTVFSVAGERRFSDDNLDMTLEGEVAHFAGDHNGLTGSASGQERNGNGYFFEFAGRSKVSPWDYRFRFDSYDQDFRPTGAIVTPDRRSAELHSGWVFNSGIRMRGRMQFFNDGWETVDPTSTRTVGLNFTGPLLQQFFPDINGNLDAFIQNRDNETGSIENLTHNFNLSLTKPLGGGWLGRSTLFFQNFHDESPANADLLTRQLTFNADHDFQVFGLSGVITPGLMLRTLRRGNSDSTDINPTVAVSLAEGPHNVRLDYGNLVQNRSLNVSGPDINTNTLNLDYRFTRKQHLFGLEANLFSRDPQPGDTTDAYRVSAYWTYEFDKPELTVAAQGRDSSTADTVSSDLSLSIINLAPGTTADRAQQILSKANVRGGVGIGNLILYEYALYEEVIRRQRLAIEYDAGLIERTAVIIDFDNFGDRDSIFQTYERVREALIRRLGNPARVIEEGEFTANFVNDVNSQRLIRIVEWSTPAGLIRFGIPRRLDNQVRMEVQHAISFPPINDTLWSIPAVR